MSHEYFPRWCDDSVLRGGMKTLQRVLHSKRPDANPYAAICDGKPDISTIRQTFFNSCAANDTVALGQADCMAFNACVATPFINPVGSSCTTDATSDDDNSATNLFNSARVDYCNRDANFITPDCTAIRQQAYALCTANPFDTTCNGRAGIATARETRIEHCKTLENVILGSVESDPCYALVATGQNPIETAPASATKAICAFHAGVDGLAPPNPAQNPFASVCTPINNLTSQLNSAVMVIIAILNPAYVKPCHLVRVILLPVRATHLPFLGVKRRLPAVCNCNVWRFASNYQTRITRSVRVRMMSVVQRLMYPPPAGL